MTRVVLPMLVLGLLMAAASSGCAPEPRQEQGGAQDPGQADVIAEIRRLGGKLEIDEAQPGKPVIGIELAGLRGPVDGGSSTAGDSVLARLGRLSQLRFLKFDNSEVTDAGLVHLKALTQLQSLSLKANKLTDAGLMHLKGLTRLQRLDLSHNQFTGVGLASLKGLTHLEALHLQSTQMVGPGLAHLEGLPQLQELNLSFNRITDTGLVHLKGLRQLKSLKLSFNQFTDAGLANLKGLTQLQNLSLNSNQVADAGLVNLKELRQLENLSLATTWVSDAGLVHLKGLTQLREMNLFATLVTEDSVEDLVKALPNVKIKPRIRKYDYPPVQIEEMVFADPAVAEKFRRMDAAARRVAEPGWCVRPYCNAAWSGGPPRYWALWCRQRYLNEAGWSCRPGRRLPNHSISLLAEAERESPKAINGFELSASWIPQTGWGAHVRYQIWTAAAQVRQFFNMSFFHDDYDVSRPADRGWWAVQLANSCYSGHKRYGDLSYHVQVSVHGNPHNWMGDTRVPRDQDVIRFLGSQEEFRAAALAELDKLEALAREQIPSGEAIIGVTSYADVRSDNPPWEVFLSPENQPTKEQKEEMLRGAIQEIERRRCLVRQHYREMHAAARQAFPLVECLTDESKE